MPCRSLTKASPRRGPGKLSVGRRQELASDSVEVTARRWYKIRVLMEDDEITCWLDGEELLYSSDSHFERAGKVGLWTKADAVTSFDDLVVRSANED